MCSVRFWQILGRIKGRLPYLTARDVGDVNCQTQFRSAADINAWHSLGCKGLLK
jgi:hypothetical protein